MSLFEKLENEMKAALKAGDSVKLSVMRMLISAIKMAEIQKNVKALGDSDVLQIIQRQIKQHSESIEQFKKGNRQDLVEKEAKELELLKSYMPAQIGEDELRSIIKDAVAETGASTKADMGKVMKIVMEKAKGRADGKLINSIVATFLK